MINEVKHNHNYSRLWFTWVVVCIPILLLGCNQANNEKKAAREPQEVSAKMTESRINELLVDITSSNQKLKKDSVQFIAANGAEIEEMIHPEAFRLVQKKQGDLAEAEEKRLHDLLLMLFITNGEKAKHIYLFVLSNFELNMVTTSLVVASIADRSDASEYREYVHKACEIADSSFALRDSCDYYKSKVK